MTNFFYKRKNKNPVKKKNSRNNLLIRITSGSIDMNRSFRINNATKTSLDIYPMKLNTENDTKTAKKNETPIKNKTVSPANADASLKKFSD